MNRVVVRALNMDGRRALKAYCAKYKKKRPSLAAKVLQKALPFREEVDDLESPSKIEVTLSRALEGQAHLIMPKIEKSVVNILCKFGGVVDDFEVDFL